MRIFTDQSSTRQLPTIRGSRLSASHFRGRMSGTWTWSQLNLTSHERTSSASPTSISGPSQSDDVLERSRWLSLTSIRTALIRQEDTIIFSLIERAQFALNKPVYQSDSVPVPGFRADGTRYSPLEYLLRETEQLHGSIRRFTSPDEHPFFREATPTLVLPPRSYPQVLAPYSKEINVNGELLEMYVNHLLPNITSEGDDNNYGSCAMNDVIALQALSKRVHYGKFVAEAKFLHQKQEYTALIRKQDRDGIMDLLTDRAVEQQDYTAEEPAEPQPGVANIKVDPIVVADLYETWVMPLTKQVEVEYLLRRLEWDD